MMGVLNEAIADQEVIKSLLKHIRKLEDQTMSKILFDENGVIYKAHHYEELTTDDVDGEVSDLQAAIKSIEAIKVAAAKIATPEVAEVPVAEAPVVDQPVEAQPTPEEVVAAPEETVPTPAPEAPAVEAPVVAANPADDPTLAADSTVAPAETPVEAPAETIQLN
jgi:hypothetical protein